MPNNSFSAFRAAQDLKSRGRQIDAAVQSQSGAPAGHLMAGAREARPRPPTTGIGASAEATRMQTDPAAGQQVADEQSEMVRRMNAGEDPAAIRADIAARSQGPQLHELENPTPGQTMEMARGAVDRMPAGETEATPEENAEYDRALGGLSKVLYENVDTSNAVIDMIQPEEKVGSVAQAAIMVITQMDQQMDLNENVFAELTRETVDRIVDLGEQTKGINFSDDDVKNALGAAWEGILNVYHVPENAQSDLEELTQGMSQDDVAAQADQYKKFLGD